MVRAARPLHSMASRGNWGPLKRFSGSENRGSGVPEVLQEVVAGAHGDAGHGGVGEADDPVGHLVDGAVAAAGVEPQVLPGLGHGAGGLGGVARPLGEDALHLQAVAGLKALGHLHQLHRGVPLPGGGIDDEYMLHCSRSYFTQTVLVLRPCGPQLSILLCQRLAPMGLDSPIAGRVGEKLVSSESVPFYSVPPRVLRGLRAPELRGSGLVGATRPHAPRFTFGRPKVNRKTAKTKVLDSFVLIGL